MPGIVDKQVGQQPKQAAKVNPVVDRVRIAARKILAAPNVAKQVVNIIRQSAGPQGIANATIFLLQLVFSKAKSVPQQSIPECIANVAMDVAALGESARLYKLTPEMAKQAAMVAMKMYFDRLKQRSQQQQPEQAQSGEQPAAAPAVAQAPPVAATTPIMGA